MPMFRIVGRGRKTGRERTPVYQAIDEPTAVLMAEEDETVVESVTRLPDPPVTQELVDEATRLGIDLPEGIGRPMAVAAILAKLAANQLRAEIVHRGEAAVVEPYAFRKSKQGVRLCCWVDSTHDPFQVVTSDQTEGWHLYLLDDIVAVKGSSQRFQVRPYVGGQDDIVIRIGIDGADFGYDRQRRKPTKMDKEECEALGLKSGSIASANDVMRYAAGAVLRERERLARVFENAAMGEIAVAIRDESQDNLVFKWNGPEVPLDTPPKSLEEREREQAAEEAEQS
jgi:hypothetical protein